MTIINIIIGILSEVNTPETSFTIFILLVLLIMVFSATLGPVAWVFIFKINIEHSSLNKWWWCNIFCNGIKMGMLSNINIYFSLHCEINVYYWIISNVCWNWFSFFNIYLFFCSWWKRKNTWWTIRMLSCKIWNHFIKNLIIWGWGIR